MQRTFVHLPGVGSRTEERIWHQGITTWDRFRRSDRVKGISKRRKAVLDRELEECESALRTGHWEHIVDRLPHVELWRAYGLLEPGARYIDIETDGLSTNCRMTVLGIARPGTDGVRYRSLVRGIDLTRSEAARALEGAKVLVTFNGASFDLPVIRRELGEDIVPKVPHVDLRYLARKAGLTGGLKALERRLGIVRDAQVQMIAGHDAVRLWSVWERKRHKRALEILVDYNREDVVNLAPLASILHDIMVRRLMARAMAR
jgi:uncharacterized protein YprB with RNaseH-like and TPR domain